MQMSSEIQATTWNTLTNKLLVLKYRNVFRHIFRPLQLLQEKGLENGSPKDATLWNHPFIPQVQTPWGASHAAAGMNALVGIRVPCVFLALISMWQSRKGPAGSLSWWYFKMTSWCRRKANITQGMRRKSNQSSPGLWSASRGWPSEYRFEPSMLPPSSKASAKSLVTILCNSQEDHASSIHAWILYTPIAL